MYPFALRSFLRDYLTCFRLAAGPDLLSPTGRRLLLLVYVPGFLALQLFHRVCFLLDDWLFPAWRQQPVEAPVFILGAPRSGTTFLHRLLAEDQEHFTAMTLGEIVFAPAIVQKRILAALDDLDRSLGSPLRNALQKSRHWLLEPLDRIHRVSLLEPEEDEFLLIHRWRSILQFLLVPYHPDHFATCHFDRDLPAAERQSLMAFYRDMLQRHLYAWGRGRRYLSKNPAFAAKVASLYQVFPDARILVPLRSPLEVLPSLLSLTATVGRMLSLEDLSGPVHVERVQDFLEFLYHHPRDAGLELFGEGYRELRYHDLLANLEAEILAVYDLLGLTPGGAFRKKLADQDAKSRGYRSPHAYSLADFGLAEEAVRERFQSVMERFQL